MRAHLLLTGLALLGLVWACYPTAACVTSCGETFSGSDCYGFNQAETRTVAAFGTCDAGSPDDACAALSGWRVAVLLPSQAPLRDDAGDREWPAPPNTEGADGGLKWAYGQADWNTRTITLADEHWASGVAATELVHVATGETQANYSAWPSDGRACVVAVASRGPFVLTGSNGGTQ